MLPLFLVTLALTMPQVPLGLPRPAPRPAEVRPLWLRAGAFPPSPRHPSALVYLPPGLDPGPPLSLVIYLHGYNNCVRTVAGEQEGPCVPGGPPRRAHALMRQLDRSGKNAVLLCPELAFDQRSGDAGALERRDGLRALLTEVFGQLRDRLGPQRADRLGRVVLVAHSGGFQAAAALLQRGGVRVDEVYLLDAVYGDAEDFAAWFLRRQGEPGPPPRLQVLYTPGTEEGSRELAARLSPWAAEPDAGVRIVPVHTPHHEVPRAFLAGLLRDSGLPDRGP